MPNLTSAPQAISSQPLTSRADLLLELSSPKRKHHDTSDSTSAKRARGDDEDSTKPAPSHKFAPWPPEEKDRFLQWLLAPESEEHFQLLQVNSPACMRQVLAVSSSLLSSTEL
jgi:hypothetical protein